jgi:arsenate reductase-like glutaredoxin family protein
MTCTRSQEFLVRNDLKAKTTVDARSKSMGAKEALELAAEADEIYASKGQKAVHLNLKKDKPSKDEILAVMLGPTGNLRAPTIKRGKTLLIGFDEDTYKKVFK